MESCSAALGLDANLDQVTEDLYTTHFDTNVKGPIFLTQSILPHLSRGGRIVFISSAAARLGVAGQTVYAATKAANEALARVWAKELGQSHGITVNCVNPGPVATGRFCWMANTCLGSLQFLPRICSHYRGTDRAANDRSMGRKRGPVPCRYAALDRVDSGRCQNC